MRNRSLAVSGALLLVLGMVGGCDPDIELDVSTLEVYVQKDAPPVPAVGASVTVSPMPVTAVIGSTGNTTFTAVPGGTYSVQVSLAGYCVYTTSVTLLGAVTTTVNVDLGTSPCTAVDQVSSGGPHDFYSLVDVRTGTSADPLPCDNDRVLEGTGGIADLPQNALSLGDLATNCHGAAWIFTADHAPWFSNTAAVLPWTDANGDLVTAALPAGRLRVPVTFWIADPLVDSGGMRSRILEHHLVGAESFLRSQRTGLRLTNSETADTDPDIIPVATLTDPLTGSTPAVGSDCRSTPNIIASSLVYRVDHLNVYIVSQLGPMGINCRENGAANVIFMDDGSDFITLVHEIGHGLGLTIPQWGHANKLEGMKQRNFMWSGIMVDPDNPEHATLGQVARMHVDPVSWLNQVSGVGTIRTRQAAISMPPVTTCSCPGIEPTNDCPAFNKDIERPGALSTPPLDPPACHVVPDRTCLPLTVGETGRITLNAYTDNMLASKGGGGGTVASLSPGLASVTKPKGGEATGFVQADVTALAAGDASVLIGYGGNLVTIPVKIGSACP